MIKKGVRLQNRQTEDKATVVFVDGKEITILVDGYEASNIYDLNELTQEWEVIL